MNSRLKSNQKNPSTCLLPEEVDAWVPGGVDAARMCSSALQGCMAESHDPRYRHWFYKFAHGSAHGVTPTCPGTGFIGGGCQALIRPESSMLWTSQLKPLLKTQLKRFHAGMAPLPIGDYNGNEA